MGFSIIVYVIDCIYNRVGAEGDDCSERSDNQLPWELLRRRDPILWNAQLVLYEDDLHDFGYVSADCKIVKI